MDLRFFYSIILTLLPFTELRVGLPLAVTYALDKGIPVLWIFLLIVLLNVSIVFLIFYFLDNIHNFLMSKSNYYKRFFNKFLEKFQKKVDLFEKRHKTLGFIALTLFVALPFPTTGAWSASLISWVLDLDRKKSIFSISMGIIIAGILVLLATLNIINLFS